MYKRQALDRIVSFMNTTENPPVERLLIPDMALTAAEYFAVDVYKRQADYPRWDEKTP